MSQTWPSITGTTAQNQAVKTLIPAALETLRTAFSGATEPASPVAYQLWADTAENLLKRRNAANSAWVIIGPLLGNAGNGQKDRHSTGTMATAGYQFSPFCTPAVIRRIGIFPSATTTGSSAGVTEYAFQLVNLTTTDELFSSEPSTATTVGGVGGGEFTAGQVYWLNVDQFEEVAEGDVLELQITKTGSPTAVASFSIVLDFYELSQ